jgi:glyoxylase-like metal-dependent hydrolase (beta-lactamase superfamily II)
MVALVCCSLSAANAQQDFSKVAITSEPLAPNVHVLFGAGGNMALLTGADGAVLVDDQFAPLAPKIRAAIALLTDKPVRFLINTHWHSDHTGGNEAFGKTGSVIIAHDNTLKRLSSKQFVDFFKMDVPPSPQSALPVVTFAHNVSLHLNGEHVSAVHVSNAHTDTDTLLFFANANVVHTGDLYMNPWYPFVDLSSAGSVDGYLTACRIVLERTNEATKVIPGHGPVASRGDYQAWCSMLTTVRERVWQALRKRRTLQQTLDAKPTAEFDTKYGTGFIKGDVLITTLYTDLARKRSR